MPTQLNIGLSHIGVQDLIASIDEGSVVLPDFQRDFVWPTSQVGKLLESLLSGYYINTLLTLPVAKGTESGPPFPPRRVEGAPEPENKQMNMQMVLDGQQRITSIYYALKAPDVALDNTKYPQIFCLRFSKVVEGEPDEDAIKWRRADWGTSQKLLDNDFEVQMEKDLVPFTIFQSNDAFKDWRRGMEDYARETDQISKEQIDAFEDNTEVFQNYQIPIIQLAGDTPDSKVVRTFERINTQGLELGVFDILTARLWTENIRLRDLWDDTLHDYSRIEAYSEGKERRTKELILKTLALSRGDECKDRNLRELDPQGFDSDWETTVGMIDRALEKAQSAEPGGLGVTPKFGFPYTAMLPTLTNLISIAEDDSTYPTHDRLEKVHRWYWLSVFSKRYSGSSDTKLYKDINEMANWIRSDDEEEQESDNLDPSAGQPDDPDEVPEAIAKGPQVIPVELDLDSLYRGGLYSGIMSLLTLNGARDFGTFEAISLHKVDDHHIFPKARLKEGIDGRSYERTERDRILNRTIIEQRNNRFNYKDRLPSEYVGEMIDEHPDGEKGVRNLLESHFIDEDAFQALLDDDYDRFCQSRKSAIRDAIEARVGEEIDWERADEEVEI